VTLELLDVSGLAVLPCHKKEIGWVMNCSHFRILGQLEKGKPTVSGQKFQNLPAAVYKTHFHVECAK
jgi:hypothetical protein